MYTCTAQNGVRTGISKTINVTVNGKKASRNTITFYTITNYYKKYEKVASRTLNTWKLVKTFNLDILLLNAQCQSWYNKIAYKNSTSV